MRLPILLIGFLTASFLCGCVNSLENALDAQAITTNSILPPRQSSDADESINPLAEETTSDSGNSLFDLQEEDVASSGEEVNPKLAFPVGFPESLRGKQRKVLFPDDKWVLQQLVQDLVHRTSIVGCEDFGSLSIERIGQCGHRWVLSIRGDQRRFDIYCDEL